MQNLECLETIDKIVKSKYSPTEKLETVGYSLSGANAILNYKDGDLEIRIKCSKKATVQIYFDTMKSKGNFKNIDFEKFNEKYEEGIPLEEIEGAIRKEQLPGMDGKEINKKGEKSKK